MREDDAIQLLATAFASPRSDILVGIGDDAAVLAASEGPLVLSVDAALEGVHFRRSFATLAEIGARSFLAAISDLAAMGAEPRAALISLALPHAEQDTLLELSRGLAAAAEKTGCPIVGGNLTRASELGIHTTVIGTLVAPPLTRSGARVGDALWVSGTLGAAGLGLAAIQASRGDEPRCMPFAARWRGGRAQLDLGRALRGTATSCMDVSDGLLRDADRLAEASRVALEIDVENLPLEPGHAALAEALGLDGIEVALSGGEDYELLFTAPASFTTARATRIGRVVSGSGVRALTNGQPYVSPRGRAAHRGHDHFE